jgi:MSHA biogenesis protein MshJ
MNMPPAIEKMTARFDAMSMRERSLVAACGLVGIGMIWMLTVLDPLRAKERALDAERMTLEEQISTAQLGIQTANENDPTLLALAKEKELQTTLAGIDDQLASQSAGLIPPERMVQVIHDVLSRQRGLTLVSLHNKPMTSLVPPVEIKEGTTPQAEAQLADEPDEATGGPQAEPDAQAKLAKHIETGPYVHPIELVIEGSYLDVLEYLKVLEKLEWHFYWKVLDLETTRFPVNRVRIELSTLSMEKEWIGV